MRHDVVFEEWQKSLSPFHVMVWTFSGAPTTSMVVVSLVSPVSCRVPRLRAALRMRYPPLMMTESPSFCCA